MKKVNKARKITENDVRNLHYIHENEELIPSGITKLEDEDIISAEVITENKNSKATPVNEDYLYDFDYFVDGNSGSKPNRWDLEKPANEILRLYAHQSQKYYNEVSDLSKKDIEKLICKIEKEHRKNYEESHDIYPYRCEICDKVFSSLMYYYYFKYGRTEFYVEHGKKFNFESGRIIEESFANQYHKSTPVNESKTVYDINLSVDKKDPADVKEEANYILSTFGYHIDPDQKDLEEIIEHFDMDYADDPDYAEYIITLLGYYYLMFGSNEFYEQYASKYGTVVDEAPDVTVAVNEDDMDEFKKLIDSDVWKQFREDWKGADIYDVAMEAISYVDILPEMINVLKKVLTEYDALVDYEEGLDKLLSSTINENNLDALSKLVNSDVWKRFKQDCGEKSNVYDAAMRAIHNVIGQSYGYHDLSDLVTVVKKVLDAYNILANYGSELDALATNEVVNEYKTVGVYKSNDGEVEDLYYIQAGDIILINHKDYGELQCKVKKVDIDKNKVYFVTIERGIMGVCGFDKIHGIELVDECQKKPMFVQTKHIKFPEGGMCYMCYAKIGDRFVDVYCTFGMSLDNCECIKLLNMTEDEFGIIDNIMTESDTYEDAKQRVYNSGLMSL